jgi:hypothetical protein
LPAVSIAADNTNAVWSSWEAVVLNVVEAAKKGGTGIAALPYVFVDAGQFLPDGEFEPLGGESWRMPISFYYIDKCDQATAHLKLRALREYFDLPTRQFTNWSVMEYGMIDASGGNPVVAELGSKVRTTLRGGVLRYEPGWEV